MKGTDMFKRILAIVLAGVSLPLCAHALGEQGWLVVNGGGGNYSMSELNQEIDTYNSSTSGAQYPKVSQGASFGGSVGFELTNRWSFGFGLDRLYADTKASDATG